MKRERGSTGMRNAAIVIGSLFLSLLVLYAIKVNLMHQREPIRLDMPDTSAGMPAPREREVRPASVAGEFYPDDPEELREAVMAALEHGSAEAAETAPPHMVIVPHAGYAFSGDVAGAAYAAMRDRHPDRVIIVSRSHTDTFDGVRTDDRDAWATPLGEVRIDREFVRDLVAATPAVTVDREAQDGQHVIEVQLPFVSETFGKDVPIVPLLFGGDDPETVVTLADALVPLMDAWTVVIASSDLSHYPAYDDAVDIDRKVVDTIITVPGPEQLHGALAAIMESAERPPETLACSEPAIALAVELSRRFRLKPTVLAMANSGDADPSKKDSVVGYAAIAFSGPDDGINDAVLGTGAVLDEETQQYALAIARQSIAAVFWDKMLDLGTELPDALMRKAGVFVSMKIGDALRGSIGTFEPRSGLGETIKAMALTAAFEDNRFQPLTAEEFDKVRITVSVLSPTVRVPDTSSIVLGKHGVRVAQGDHVGVFLPQVAEDFDMDLDAFMGELCEQKAGLPRDCWKDPATEIRIFTAQVISEPEGSSAMTGTGDGPAMDNVTL